MCWKLNQVLTKSVISHFRTESSSCVESTAEGCFDLAALIAVLKNCGRLSLPLQTQVARSKTPCPKPNFWSNPRRCCRFDCCNEPVSAAKDPVRSCSGCLWFPSVRIRNFWKNVSSLGQQVHVHVPPTQVLVLQFHTKCFCHQAVVKLRKHIFQGQPYSQQ